MEGQDVYRYTDPLVGLETAILAKEKGFKMVETTFQYNSDGSRFHRDYIPHDFNIRGLLSAPTQNQVQKWLRETHNIDLWVEKYPNDTTYIPQCPILDSPRILGFYKTYEEALERVLQEVLNKLI